MSTRLSPQELLKTLPRSAGAALTVRQITELLAAAETEVPLIRFYVDEFLRTGLMRGSSGRYWRARNSELLIGKLVGTRSGHAFVIPDDRLQRDLGDIFIGDHSMGSAMHGDIVIVRLGAASRRRREGKIEAVLQRASSTVVGRFIRLSREQFVSPIEDRFLHEIDVAPSDTLGAADGEIVNIEITRYPVAGRPPLGRIIEVLGREDSPGIDLKIIIRKHGLRDSFPGDVLEESEAIPDEIGADQINGRLDLRSEPAITIDGESARDFDDAVSLRFLPNDHYLLGVHIADVSHYVGEGTALDAEAQRRGTSVYFPERAIPMLPERLSNGICSLKPGVDRLTMSALLEMDRTGRLVDYRLVPSVIHSRERMTYTDVNALISEPEGAGSLAGRYSHIHQMLLEMHELALILIKRREERGAIDFELPEAELIFNDEGAICGVARSERNIAHRLIEEFMLVANETVARHLASLGAPLIYRIHEEPTPLKIEEFASIAESFGHRFSVHGPIPQRGFQHVLKKVRGRTEEKVLSYLMLRSMERARYSEQNLGHFGLAMKTYTHFTSPIRRYPDLAVHRMLREILESGGEGEYREQDLGRKRAVKVLAGPLLSEEREQELRRAMTKIAESSTERERTADNAERELMDWRKAQFIASCIGDHFDGVITTVKDYGFYVELLDHFVEGLVHVSMLRDDRYEFEERKFRLIGQRSGRIYKTGDRVRVSVDRVDKARHLIDFSLAGR